jgi:hypothetical protein
MRNTPAVQVLDTAVPAVRKSRPIRWLLVTTATVLAFVLSVLLAAGLEALRRMKNDAPERFEHVIALARELRLARLLDRL